MTFDPNKKVQYPTRNNQFSSIEYRTRVSAPRRARRAPRMLGESFGYAGVILLQIEH